MTERVRLAIVASHPIQHFCPLYREIALDERVEVKVFFASAAGVQPYYDPGFGREVSWGGDLTDGFEHEVLLPRAESIADAVSQARVAPALDDYAPDVVQVYGYGDRLARRGLFWSVRRRIPALMISDSELLSAGHGPKAAAKRAVLWGLLRVPAGFLTIGDENERYYRHYGVDQARLHHSPIPIDTPALDELLQTRSAVRSQERQAWQVAPDDVVLLSVGKSIPRKRHEDVVEAVALLPEDHRTRAVVALAGGGESTAALRARADELGVRLLTLGFLPLPSLLRAYLGADVLVHPSEADPHPLAIAEAVYSGLPVTVSDRVGSWGPSDDVRPGANGLRHRVGDVDELSSCLATWMEEPTLRIAAASASSEIGRSRTLSRSAQTYVDGVMKVSNR